MDRQNQPFSIQQLSHKLNIPKSTIRFWEKEFKGLIVPGKTKGGQRRYTSEHINIFEGIKKLKEKGMNLSEIKRNFENKSTRRYSKFDRIDTLAERLTELIKNEIINFLDTSKDN